MFASGLFAFVQNENGVVFVETVCSFVVAGVVDVRDVNVYHEKSVLAFVVASLLVVDLCVNAGQVHGVLAVVDAAVVRVAGL